MMFAAMVLLLTQATPGGDAPSNDPLHNAPRNMQDVQKASAAPPTDAPWLFDRGPGVHNSQFGSYTAGRELQVYLFYEYTVNHDQEYKPEELGFTGSQDFRAKRVDHEALLWIAYGFTDDLMIELESALFTVGTQHKASNDTSAMPQSITERGVGDTEGQIRYRFIHEAEVVPEFMAFFEFVTPLQKRKVVIGTQDWEFSLGLVATKGFSWGTLSAKVSIEYAAGESEFSFGEWSIEYVKKLDDHWRLVLAVEGSQDEIEGIVEIQITPWKGVTFKINNGFGLTSKAPDWAPEIGVMFSF